MVRTWVVKGRLVGTRTVELDEPVERAAGEVEVIVRAQPQDSEPATASLAAFLRALPPGSRTKADIDRQLRSERGCWGG